MDAIIEAAILGDDILPAQWVAMHEPEQWTPERRLMLAVLMDAVRCYRQTAYSRQRELNLSNETADWFTSQSHYPFSFLTICDELEIDPVKFATNIDYLKLENPRGFRVARAGMGKGRVMSNAA